MSKSMKKSNPVARQQVARELTPEQKQVAIERFFTQKREAFATGVLFNFLQNPCMMEQERGYLSKADIDPRELAKWSVSVADAMIEELYPIKEEEESDNEE